jgi:TRAP-type transport system periplasmic protein
MFRLITVLGGVAMLAAASLAGLPSLATAQTTLTMSSWVSPTHPLTKNVVVAWGDQVEKATNGRVKFQMLPKHPSAPPGTFDAVKEGLIGRLLRHRELHPGPPCAPAAA